METNVFIEGLLSPITCQDHDLRHRGLTALCLNLPLWKIGDLPHVTGLVRINWHSAYKVLRSKETQAPPCPSPPLYTAKSLPPPLHAASEQSSEVISQAPIFHRR